MDESHTERTCTNARPSGSAGHPLALYTIGYQAKTSAAFLDALGQVSIELVVDVRELPLSRKRGFSKTALERTLADAGIRYASLRALGTPKPIRDRLRSDSDYVAFFKAYRQHLLTQRDALETLMELVHSARVCLMCYEADHTQCHRSLLVDELAAVENHTVRVEHV